MNVHQHAALSDCVEAIKITDATEYTVFGHQRNLAARHPARHLPQVKPDQVDHPIVAALAEDIYAQLYARLRIPRHSGARGDRVPFVARLSAANSSRRGWESGWSMLGRTGKTFLLERGGFRIQASSSELFPDPGIGRAGTTYHLDVGKELFNMIGGWYVVLGETVDQCENTEITTRIYFNIDAADASALVGLCSDQLNRNSIPFRFKLPDDPRAYGRTDTAVLYVRKQHYRDNSQLLSKILAGIRTREGVPAFAKEIGRGVAAAEDPADGFSFGQNRSHLVARGLWRAFLGQVHASEAKIQYLADEFQRAGLDHNRPHLNPHSEDIYGTIDYGS